MRLTREEVSRRSRGLSIDWHVSHHQWAQENIRWTHVSLIRGVTFRHGTATRNAITGIGHAKALFPLGHEDFGDAGHGESLLFKLLKWRWRGQREVYPLIHGAAHQSR